MKKTRKDKRVLEENCNLFKEVLKMINHFLPDLFKIMNTIEDPRHQGYIKYKQSDLLFVRLLAYMCYFNSMNQMNDEFNNDHVITNVRLLCGNHIKEVPHGDTINDYLKEANIELLKWKLNLRITGCKKDNKNYGWLLYFSQVDDITIISHLDWYVDKMKKRFNLSEKVVFKKFEKTYYEIKFNLNKTKYIINLDSLSYEEKKDILTRIYSQDINKLKRTEIDNLFYRIITKELDSLENDIQPLS